MADKDNADQDNADQDNADQDKAEIRQAAAQARREMADKDGASDLIIRQVQAMPSYRSAKSVLWYVDVRDEVRTRAALPSAIQTGPAVLVPYCVGDQMRLFRLHSIDDLQPGTFGVLEPRVELRDDPDRGASIADADVVLVPGVAFDAQGGRLGYGRGYYDRCLAEARPDVVLVGLAYQCQVCPRVPMADHDVRMDWVVTEQQLYRCSDGLGVHLDRSNC
ncbi:5-formyltetrahydrofolate cyclo-ligase [Roseiconus nitratireducens]|uniref:5-formyltetrahydrofolate cyclo-ligase n=1 Tax=Roseiconus nitratireducens TaxID=2605748 RepID=A0A5M6DFU3_9BACT|nr:5-formyltetrahydrofolate cyclo-ligase [Roseiconus nitratireducens]KAA5545152.1 5-formyltetrahydrofolate cyclo-ligase [Roseiconus nitratireducens]